MTVNKRYWYLTIKIAGSANWTIIYSCNNLDIALGPLQQNRSQKPSFS